MDKELFSAGTFNRDKIKKDWANRPHVSFLQPPGGKPMNKKVKDIQGDLAQLLYRFIHLVFPTLNLIDNLIST